MRISQSVTAFADMCCCTPLRFAGSRFEVFNNNNLSNFTLTGLRANRQGCASIKAKALPAFPINQPITAAHKAMAVEQQISAFQPAGTLKTNTYNNHEFRHCP